MKIKTLIGVALLVFFGLLFSEKQVRAQTEATNSVNDPASDTLDTGAALVGLEGDIILEEIQIEAVIEKPRVSFFPKRLDPQFEEFEFVDRSFERELKSLPDDLIIQDDRLFKPQKIENLKKMILKKRKEDKPE